ncbi:ParA family protein [Bifidobacterium pseudolongum]|uniref:ParA family protein n=1 Tax=Bifidobacterium pseudolongum TaxID=1694 RepID=UPI001F0DF612|nr:ParA family protein [Bifidobacterium pseudolongum]MCH4852273.1 ParA family protein [Bifidobacterium pseudolongum]
MDQRTRVVTVACAKGGVMKTTTSMQLAGHLARRMQHDDEPVNVVVLDSDNTGGATRWAMVAQEAGTPVPFDVVPVNQVMLNRDWIERHYAGWWIIIDTPPSDTAVIQKAIDCADVTIIPTQPSGMDLMLAGETYAATPNSIVLVGRVKPRTKLTRETLQELDDNEITRFDTVVSEREEIKRIVGTDKVDMKEYSGVTDELLDVFTQLEKEEEEE